MGKFTSIGILFVAFLIAPPTPARADYAHMTLFQMLARAEIVVSGEVRNVTDTTYDLVISEAFHGADAKVTLTVERVDTRRLGDRWADYEDGQQVILFARRAPVGDTTVLPLGAAGEGELPAKMDAVFLKALSRPPAHLTPSPHLGGSSEYYRLDETEFREAIAGFFGCYRPTKQGRIARLCDDTALQAYRELSWLATHLSGIADRLPEGEN